MDFKPGVRDTATTTDNLIAGDFPIVTRPIILQKGEDLKRGTLVARLASGKWVIAKSAEGSPPPRGILVEDVDASKADATTVVYKTGQFNLNQVTLGDGFKPDEIIDELDDRSIFLVRGQA